MLMTVGTPMSNMALAYIQGYAYEKDEFKVALNMVQLFSFLGLVFLLIPFSPLAIGLLPFMLYISIKWEAHWMVELYAKPKKPWKAQKAAFIYTVFYGCTYVLLGLTSMAKFLSTRTFPKDCDAQV